MYGTFLMKKRKSYGQLCGFEPLSLSAFSHNEVFPYYGILHNFNKQNKELKAKQVPGLRLPDSNRTTFHDKRDM
jgi:hypothetical protein